VITLGGLIATQSRFCILLAAAAVLFVLAVGYLQTKTADFKDQPAVNLRLRIKVILWTSASLIILIVALKSGLFADVLGRFEQLVSFGLKETTTYRMLLWKRALLAFLDHPVIGVGPGGFYRLHEIYSTLHLTPSYPFLRSLGAHNLLLHFLADTGLIGGAGLIALFVNQIRLARYGWFRQKGAHFGQALALYGWAFLFALSVVTEANWMWGQLSFLAIFFAALVSRQYSAARFQ
jgi:O-antigen ligase